MNIPNFAKTLELRRSTSRGKRLRPGFTLVELLVVVLIIIILASLSFTGYRFTQGKVQMAKSLESMRQLATATLLYSQDHNGFIPRGDEGADGAGLGGRGIIWINHIAPNIGYPELESLALNQSRDGLGQWTYLLTRYKSAPFVCGGLDKTELEKAKAKTSDVMGGIGYNVQPLLASVGGSTVNNASWGNVGAPISLSAITHLSYAAWMPAVSTGTSLERAHAPTTAVARTRLHGVLGRLQPHDVQGRV